ncbi:glycosyltransferase family 8 protein [Pleurotus ostreatus PC15]|uniref:Glycosyltransferase family 8 protein n=1 Tax=Pleurotus ostreatus (strain PC15) TaxID=1137138 RepID=A0A067P184_PLEO1|nr:glycosyltransferase family 8 protein [Pleurotus ostreatus PC15]
MALQYFFTGWTHHNSYQILPNDSAPRRKSNFFHRYALPATLLLLLAATIFLLVEGNRWRRIYSPFDDYQPLNPFPVVHAQSNGSNPNALAVVSTLYSNNYAIATAVLAHSIRRTKSPARLILLYIDGQVSEEALCISRSAGWELLAVPRIAPPRGGKGVRWHFIDQFTKLHVWSLDKMGVERLVYLDADTLVRQNFDELFHLPFDFAAVPDVYGPGDVRGFSLTFNAGVLAIRPSSTVLQDMKEKTETARYPALQAEQSFLNLYFGAKAARLPYIYNALIAIKRRNPVVWKELKEELSIVHYTDHKPFLLDGQPGENILTAEETRKAVEEARQKYGLWSEEFGWWGLEYERMMKEMDRKFTRCKP